jgi:hypothetical protein
MRATNICVNAKLSKCLQFVIGYTMLEDEKKRFYQSIHDYFAVEATVKVEPGDLAPGTGWAGLGDQYAHCLCEIGLDVLYRAAGLSLADVKAKIGTNHGLFLLNSDFKAQVAEPQVFAIAPYESPMERIYMALPDYETVYNSVRVTTWLRK